MEEVKREDGKIKNRKNREKLIPPQLSASRNK